MKNSGYVSVGHILGSKEEKDHFKAMRHFCSILFCNMDEDVVHKSSGFWLYDRFMSTTQVTVESFSKLLSSMLKNQATDELEFQRKIEVLAWDLVKFNYDSHTDAAVDRRLLFKIFCIFNRFCDPRHLPLRLTNLTGRFLLQKLGLEVDPTKSDLEMDLDEFIRVIKPILMGSDEQTIGAIDRLYNKLVRFVLHQDRVRFRVIRDAGKAISFKALTATPSAPKTIVVNHRNLTIYEDDIKDLDRIGKGLDNEPHGSVLHRFPLAGAVARTRNSGGLLRKAKSTLVILTGCGTTSIELNFNAFNDEYKLFKFAEAIEQASELTKLTSDPLTKVYQVHKFRPDYFQQFQEEEPLHNNNNDAISLCDLKLKANASSRGHLRAKLFGDRVNAAHGEDVRYMSAPDLPGLGKPQAPSEPKLAADEDTLSDSGVSSSSEENDAHAASLPLEPN